jgi:hypothetical protein
VHTRFVELVQFVVSYLPAGQMAVQVALCVPPRQYDSFRHDEHTLLLVLVQGVVSYVPARQTAVHVSKAVPPRQ